MLRKLRIAVLLLILATVAQSAWLAKSRATRWQSSLQVAVYPIKADRSVSVADYVARLDQDQFESIERFMEREAKRYGIETLRPVDVSLAPIVDALPPPAPSNGNALRVILWSLQLRWWAWRHDAYTGPKPQVKLYVIYHDANRTDRVDHSLGLEKGMIGVVHAYGARRMASQNSVIIAHELLHTLGATDKYDLSTNQPQYPEGYAEPERSPLYPQSKAEIMGGRTPITDTRSEIPAGLDDSIVGTATAREIKWIKG